MLCRTSETEKKGDVSFLPTVGYLDGFISPVGSDISVFCNTPVT